MKKPHKVIYLKINMNSESLDLQRIWTSYTAMFKDLKYVYRIKWESDDNDSENSGFSKGKESSGGSLWNDKLTVQHQAEMYQVSSSLMWDCRRKNHWIWRHVKRNIHFEKEEKNCVENESPTPGGQTPLQQHKMCDSEERRKEYSKYSKRD